MSCFHDFFTEEELTIIRRSKYDINAGRNIIFLPEDGKDTKYHLLPYHCSNHLKYNNKIKKEFKKNIRSVIEEMKDEKHDAIASKAEEELHKLEDSNFKYLTGTKFSGGKRLD